MKALPLTACLATLLCVVGVALAQNAPERIRFTRYDPSLGLPNVDPPSDVAFSGRIRVGGRLIVEREQELCDGACAYLIPDRESQKRLPRRILREGPVPIRNIQLYDAGPILERLLGRREARRWLASGKRTLAMPVVLTLDEVRIYGACDAIHYEARVVDAEAQGRYAAVASLFQGGC